MLRPPAATDDEDGEESADSEEEWSGITDPDPPPIDHEAEYIDEEKYTTVTVESMDVSKEGLFKAQQDQTQEIDGIGASTTANADESASEKKRRPWAKENPKDTAKKRRKKRNFRYEGKVERKEARSKEKARNRKQAQERRSDR